MFMFMYAYAYAFSRPASPFPHLIVTNPKMKLHSSSSRGEE